MSSSSQEANNTVKQLTQTPISDYMSPVGDGGKWKIRESPESPQRSASNQGKPIEVKNKNTDTTPTKINNRFSALESTDESQSSHSQPANDVTNQTTVTQAHTGQVKNVTPPPQSSSKM